VDDNLHPDAAAILRNFIRDRKCGFLFQSANGTLLDPGRSAGTVSASLLKQMGRDPAGTLFHVFRVVAVALPLVNSIHIH
jgi:hypothetical protein